MKRRMVPFVLAFLLPMLVLLPCRVAADANDEATKSLLHMVDGTILDFDATRILWEQNDKVLWLYSRTDGTEVKVYDGTDTTDLVNRAKLSAEGVVYNLEISPEGTILYTAPSAPVNALALYQMLPDGTVTQLASPTAKIPKWLGVDLGFYEPLTDGNSIVYSEYMMRNNEMIWVLRLRNADQAATLAINSITGANVMDYRLNNGWVAYVEYNKEIQRKTVKVRSPEGVVKQVFVCPDWWSWTAAPVTLNELGPDGTVAFTFNDKSYLYYTPGDKTVSISRSPAKFQYREHVFTGPEGSPYRIGGWYLQAENSLYAVRI